MRGVKRLHRVVGIALLLSARRRLTAEELSKHFAVSLRTIYRDIAALADAGYPLLGTAGDGYTLSPAAHLRPLALTADEAEVLTLGARMLETIADAPVAERVRSATAKLEAVLAIEAVRRLRTHRRTVVMAGEPEGDPGPLALVLSAVSEQRVLAIGYDGIARGERTEREIEPLGLVRLGRYWLVPAYCRLREDVRGFRLDRMREARLTGEVFTPREGVTLEAMRERAHRERQGGG